MCGLWEVLLSFWSESNHPFLLSLLSLLVQILHISSTSLCSPTRYTHYSPPLSPLPPTCCVTWKFYVIYTVSFPVVELLCGFKLGGRRERERERAGGVRTHLYTTALAQQLPSHFIIPPCILLFTFSFTYFSHRTSDVCCRAELRTNLFIQWAHHYSSLSPPLCFHCSKLSIFLCCPLTSVDNIKTCERYIQCGLPPFLFSVSPNVPLGLWQDFFHLLGFVVLCLSKTSFSFSVSCSLSAVFYWQNRCEEIAARTLKFSR